VHGQHNIQEYSSESAKEAFLVDDGSQSLTTCFSVYRPACLYPADLYLSMC